MISRLSDHARRVRHDDDGFTLVELLMSIVIGTIIVAAAFGAATAAARLQNKTTNRIDAINRGRNAIEAITQAVRSQQCAFGTRPMLWASDTGMMFYASGAAYNTTTPTNTTIGIVQPITRIRLEWIANNTAQQKASQITNSAHTTGNIVMSIEKQTNPGVTPMTFGKAAIRTIAQDVEQAPSRDQTVTNTTPASSIKWVPFFQYFKYQNAVGDGEVDYDNPLPMVPTASDPLLNPLGSPSVAAANLSGIILVQVNFRSTPRQARSDGDSGVIANSAGVNFYNTISVRIADPSNPGGSPQCL